MATLSLWWRAVRPFSFTVSVIPPFLGTMIAVMDVPGLAIHWPHFILTLIGCPMAHAGANLLSDYYDYLKGVDREGTYGSSGLLVAKKIEPGTIRLGAWTLLAGAALIGVYLGLRNSNSALLFGVMLLGGLLGVFYTAGPVALKYRALGDLAVFFAFGSLMVLGAYVVQTHRFSWNPVLYAVPIALLVDAILHSNNLRDIENDSAVPITTLAGAVGKEASKAIYYGLISGAYLITVLLILFAGLPLISLVTFISLPLGLKLISTVRDMDKIPLSQFARIDADTAQFHSAFGALLLASLLIQHLLIR